MVLNKSLHIIGADGLEELCGLEHHWDNVWMDGWTDGRMDRWMDGQVDLWMGG